MTLDAVSQMAAAIIVRLETAFRKTTPSLASLKPGLPPQPMGVEWLAWSLVVEERACQNCAAVHAGGGSWLQILKTTQYTRFARKHAYYC